MAGAREAGCMADELNPPSEAPDGAAVFPLIPAELGVHPALLAALHAYVFLEGSEPAGGNPAGAGGSMQYLVAYLQRLAGPDLARAKEDLRTLAAFAKSDKWPKQQVRFLQDFLKD